MLLGTSRSLATYLFVFCPLLGFSIYGIVRSLRSRRDRLLDLLIAGTVVMHWFVVSGFPHWYGGHCFGPRFFADIIPYFAYFLIPVLAWLSETRSALRSWLLLSFILLTAVSLLIHLSGAVNRASHRWNSAPVNVDKSTGRVWDWHDLQFLRGVVQGPLTTGDSSQPGEGRPQR